MSLSKRLSELRTGAYADPLAEFRQLPFEEMCNHKIDFGRAHAGKKYLEVWHQEPSWVKWFVKTYESSDKLEHRKFLQFIELMIEMEEKGTTPNYVLEQRDRARLTQMPVAKAKAKMSAQPRASQDTLEQMFGEDYIEDWMEMNSGINTETIDALQARMLTMENAMTEILQHIRHEPQ